MKKLILITAVLLMLTACQSSNDVVENQELVTDNSTTPEPTETYGTPYSVGPSGPPETMVKGPTSAPPSNTSAGAQAVTTTEDIRLTLPRKTD